MRKLITLFLVLGLIAGLQLAPAEAKKKKKKAPVPVQVDQKFFLRSTGCTAADTNSDYLSVEDADEAVQCFYTGAGIRNEVGGQTGTVGAAGNNAVSGRDVATRYWDATDGIPLVLDASKPITGSIWTDGGRCVVSVSGQGCSPAGISAGEMIFDVTFVGLQGETEVEIGTFTETYQVTPGTVHELKLEIAIDPGLNGASFDSLELRTWMHGKSAGHGVINTNGDTSSFISIPALAAS
jgi:hypothetical protein